MVAASLVKLQEEEEKRSAVPGKGLEVPHAYTFTGKPVMIKKLFKLLVKL